jgi:hypothetical protein
MGGEAQRARSDGHNVCNGDRALPGQRVAAGFGWIRLDDGGACHAIELYRIWR